MDWEQLYASFCNYMDEANDDSFMPVTQDVEEEKEPYYNIYVDDELPKAC